MGEYTYATSSGKTYDEWMKEAQARAAKQAADYAAKEQAANAAYKADIDRLYDNRIQTEQEQAAAETQRVYASYTAQFDANAASQLARERRLREQMASYGLGQSGYNATNQTALAVARSNADAATRAARGNAIEAVAADLRKYTAEAENARVNAQAESDRETAQRIADTEKELLADTHADTMDLLNYDVRLDELAYEREKDARELAYEREQAEKEQAYRAERDAVADAQWEREQASYEKETLQKYVDAHNSEIYGLMLQAYNNGNAALAEAYAKELWRVDEDGMVTPMTFDTTAASDYAEKQTALENTILLEKARDEEKEEDPETGYDEFGFARKFSDEIEEARTAMMSTIQTSDSRVKKKYIDRALSIVYLIEQRTKEKGSDGYMDEQTFDNLLRYVGLSKLQYQLYVADLNIDLPKTIGK